MNTINFFSFLLLSFLIFSCNSSNPEISRDLNADEETRQWEEIVESINGALKDFEAIPRPVLVPMTATSSIPGETLEPMFWEYPEIPCAFDVEQQARFAIILELSPHLRIHEIYIVNTMRDFRYISVVLKPLLGPLFNFFRFEFDFDAIANDLVTPQDFADYDKFISKIQ